MYLELLKKSLLNELYLDDELRILYLRKCVRGEATFDFGVLHEIRRRRAERLEELAAARKIGRFLDGDIHNAGFSRTMMGRIRLDSLHECLDLVVQEGVEGDVMECGVWRGGGCIFMAGYLAFHAIADRRVIVADSFEGVPESSVDQDAGIQLDKSRFPELAVSLDEVKANFEAYGLLDDRVQFVPGWFRDSLDPPPSERLALLRLDGDLYESTMDALTALYDLVADGGIVIVDDWGVLPQCRKAVEDFFADRGERFPMMKQIDWSGVWLRKTRGT